MSSHVLQDHLLLLERLEAALAHVGGLLAETPVRSSGEVVHAALSFASRFHKTCFDEPLKRRAPCEQLLVAGFGLREAAFCAGRLLLDLARPKPRYFSTST